MMTVAQLHRYYVDNDGTNDADSETTLVVLCRDCARTRRLGGQYVEHAETLPRDEQADMQCEDCDGRLD